MSKFKKAIIIVLTGLILFSATSAFAWNVIVYLPLIETVHDIYVGMQESIQCTWKGACTKFYRQVDGRTDIYYNVDDLIAHFREYEDSYGFRASSPPINAVASLGERKLNDGARMASASGTRTEYSFENTLEPHWHKFAKGDLIFNAGTHKSNQVLEFISNWTHVGMKYDGAYMVYDSIPGRGNGVGVRRVQESFGKGYAYAIKKVQGPSQIAISVAVEHSKWKYINQPYCPPYFSAIFERENFIRSWADKNDVSNIHCAKLVWLTFKLAGVDLDSNRTISNIFKNFHETFDDLGFLVEQAWVGVSPDDIYYSKHLGMDQYLIGRLAGKYSDLPHITP